MLVALDSNVFIAALSPKEEHSINAQDLIRSIAEGQKKAVASSLVYGEVLSVSKELIDFDEFIASIGNIKTVAADDEICFEAGKLRIKHDFRLKLPDAIHLVSAIASNADVFITSDSKLVNIANDLISTKLVSEWH
jgi:predicted nucleic acid-binding protein